ncbi:hypothetical protein [Streptomyces sp. JB150]|uniref:hypothetical protein n=1 Tax=Streptomyces sp. JB150 TaxID=2714844 RepID=UPI00140A2858|nr:hypothetical protein [Streptomyces sp. JB150]QIJ65674.1 hypothetical protein G7Z13_29360 [Streptomyces sp. JB150]
MTAFLIPLAAATAVVVLLTAVLMRRDQRRAATVWWTEEEAPAGTVCGPAPAGDRRPPRPARG